MRISKFEDLTRPSPYGLRINWGGSNTRKHFKTKGDRNAWERDELQQFIKDKESKSPTSGKYLMSLALGEYLIDLNDRNKSDHTIRSAKQRVGDLIRFHGDTAVSDMNREDLIKYILTYNSEGTRSGRRSSCVTFFRWCAKRGLGGNANHWLDITWDKRRQVEEPPGILTVDQARLLMENAMVLYQPALALGLFAGIRGCGEIMKLKWSDIRWGKQILVPGAVAKMGKYRRMTNLPDNLWTWLPKKPVGSMVLPAKYFTFSQNRRRVCERIGFEYPPNGARHSFASYGYWRGVEWVMDTIGHRGDPSTFHNSYKDYVEEADAKKYFSITAE